MKTKDKLACRCHGVDTLQVKVLLAAILDITPQWERVEKGAIHMERYPTQYCLLKGEEIEVPFLWKCVNGNEEDKLFFNIF